jgi:hypothetical protein
MKHALIALGVVMVAAACVTENGDATVAETPPDRASFPVVADLLVHRCGTLDCHGMVGRNFRIYGREGLRRATDARPTSKPGTTTTEEYDETFASLVALEPEITSAVVQEGGASPDRLTFVRKARGAEHHKGGTLMNEGDEEDACIVSWLSGHTDDTKCKSALTNAF